MLFITHDFRLIQDLCDKVFVLSNGSIVEKGSTIEVFKNPQHDETKRLLQVVKWLYWPIIPFYKDTIMATPKRKTSKSKIGKRRNHQKIVLSGLSKDKKTGEIKISHRYRTIEEYQASRKN